MIEYEFLFYLKRVTLKGIVEQNIFTLKFNLF